MINILCQALMRYSKSKKEQKSVLRGKLWEILRGDPRTLAQRLRYLRNLLGSEPQSSISSGTLIQIYSNENLINIFTALIDLKKPISIDQEPELTCKVRVIIPVFGNEDDLKLLLQDLAKQNYCKFEIYVVDDGTNSKKLELLVDEHRESLKNLFFIRRKFRGGFVRACNEGLRNFKLDVAIILNSDVRIPTNFVYDLATECLSEPDIGSVSAITNKGSIASILDLEKYGTIDFSQLDFEQVNRFLKKASTNNIETFKSIEAPVGVGHAMAISGNAIRDVGILDENFSPGYGEEVDWSLRASALGYRHLINPRVFVLHKSGASFGPARGFLISKHSEMIRKMYPNFDFNVRLFVQKDPLRDFRFAFGVFCACLIARSHLVVFSHNTGGGSRNITIKQFSGDLLFKIESSGREGIAKLIIQIHEFETALEFSETDLFRFLELFSVNKVQIESLPYISDYKTNTFVAKVDRYLESIYNFVEIEITLHDFFAVCPTINLIDQFGNYCEVPDVEVCRSCLESNAFNPNDYSAADVEKWRAPFQGLFEKAHRINYFTEVTRDVFFRAFPDIAGHKFNKVEPSLQKFTLEDSIANFSLDSYEEYSSRKRTLILYLGGVNYAKGSGVLTELYRITKAENTLKFALLGSTDTALPGGIVNHGIYQRAELPMILNKILPDFVFLPSLTPETYSHCADEVIGLGFKLIAFRHTSMGERYRDHPNFYPITHSTDILEVYNQIMRVVNNNEIIPQSN